MAGAYKLAVSAVNVTATAPDGTAAKWERVTVTLQDGVARVTERGVVVATMDVGEGGFKRVGRNAYDLTGPDGVVWQVRKAGCGCGGKR